MDGIRCRKSKLLGWRSGDPTRDVDDRGNPVQSNYIVIVRISDCRRYEKDGRDYYDPTNAPQAFKLGYGGTYYGYAASRTVTNGAGRHVVVRRDGKTVYEWLCSYVKTPMYFVHDGAVYVGACYKEIAKAA